MHMANVNFFFTIVMTLAYNESKDFSGSRRAKNCLTFNLKLPSVFKELRYMYMFTARYQDYSHLQIAKYYHSMLKKTI